MGSWEITVRRQAKPFADGEKSENRKWRSAERSSPPSLPFVFTVPTHEYRSLPIPGLDGTKVGDCFVSVTSLPEELDSFMEVNPRVPNWTQKGVLSGPVVKGTT